jgi:hypothetical protein
LSAVLSIGDIALYTRAPELKVKYSWSKFIDCDLPSVQLLESIFKKTEVTEISLTKWDSDRNIIMKKENPHVWDRKHRLDSGRIDSKSLHTEIAPHRVQPFIFKVSFGLVVLTLDRTRTQKTSNINSWNKSSMKKAT